MDLIRSSQKDVHVADTGHSYAGQEESDLHDTLLRLAHDTSAATAHSDQSRFAVDTRIYDMLISMGSVPHS
jgi:hypothetical protein